MKTNAEIALASLKLVIPVLEKQEEWSNEALYETLCAIAKEHALKNGQVLWPVRTALSGKERTAGGATEIAFLLGKSETIKRLQQGIAQLEAA